MPLHARTTRLAVATMVAVLAAAAASGAAARHTAPMFPLHMGDEGRYVAAKRPSPDAWAPTSCGPANQITQWGKEVTPTRVLPEYPRPQLQRGANSWYNFNGLWEFQPGTGAGEAPPFGKTLNGSILVPFPAESCLSGVGETHKWLWYRIMTPGADMVAQAAAGDKVLLHFDAVDWQTTVYLGGKLVGSHTGGYEAFTFDVTPFLPPAGSPEASSLIELLVHVYDPSDEGFQPNGKQRISAITSPGGDTYTPSSGIWSTVWSEFVPAEYVQSVRLTPSMTEVQVQVESPTAGTEVTATLYDRHTVLGTFHGHTGEPFTVTPPPPAKLWAPGSPYLYTMNLTLAGGDVVHTYFGLRSVTLGSVATPATPDTGVQVGVDRPGNDMPGYPKPLASANPALCWAACNATAGCKAWAYGLPNCGGGSSEPLCWLKSAVGGATSNACRASGMQGLPAGSVSRPLINGKYHFLAGWLDQSFWPDGLYRAPTDAALVFDVQAVADFGLNFIRLHQKQNPARWYTYAERLGIVIQQDMIQKYGGATQATVDPFIKELRAMVTGPRYNSPAIAVWTVFNEHDCVAQFNASQVEAMVAGLDPTRLVDTDSGGPANDLYVGDLNDIHTYPFPGNPMPSATQYSQVGEYGGLGAFIAGKEWVPKKCYAYLELSGPAELASTYVGMAGTIATQSATMSSCVYTQITDVELECDGFLNYDRTAKFSDSQMAAVVAANKELVSYKSG